MKSERQKWSQQVDGYCGAGVAGWATDVHINNAADDLFPKCNAYGRENSCIEGKSFCGRPH